MPIRASKDASSPVSCSWNQGWLHARQLHSLASAVVEVVLQRERRGLPGQRTALIVNRKERLRSMELKVPVSGQTGQAGVSFLSGSFWDP
jgi:hypothetical protein